MAHLKKSSTTGHLLKNSAGHLVNGCDCTCDPDALPSPIIVDLTNLDISACSEDTCSPDQQARVYAYQTSGYCTYYDAFETWCRNGKKLRQIYIYWSDVNCRWLASVSGYGLLAYLEGSSTDPTNPSGTYTKYGSGCATGSFEVE
jgi:hypothetical protein